MGLVRDSFQGLIDLGLSLLQAKVYLALCRIGPATVGAVSKYDGIARQDVYRLMPTLEKLGLVEKMLGTPVVYKATSFREGCELLLELKVIENLELQKKTLALIDSFEMVDFKGLSVDGEAQFVVTSSKNLLRKKFDEKDRSVEKSLDVIAEWRFLRYRLSVHLEDYRSALKRGVRVRLLTDKHVIDKSTRVCIEDLSRNSLFEVRFLSVPFPAHLVIHDGLEVNLGVDDPEQTLCSKNLQFIRVIEAYFEGLWKSSVVAVKNH